ncbi:MAG TPA: ribosome small subunit-dependent GTPase A [Bacteriovoracaceae bacterium]|nr:ribosome small subunit-dependent GTPase A [Bacteriovoracaceae bacterium]
MMIRGRIFRSGKRHFDCQREDTKELVTATALAALLKEDHMVVGDFVDLSPPASEGNEWGIHRVHERTNAIFRNIPRENKKKVIAANVDVMVVVVSAGKPDYKRGLVDRYLARADFWDVPAFLVFNKMDIHTKENFDIHFESERLKWLNVECFEVSAQDKKYSPQYLQNGMQELGSMLEKKTAVFVGHSGVGKSHLITTLVGGEVKLLSGLLGSEGKGAHTTTWAELIDAEKFILIDSPGIRSLSLSDFTKEELLQSFSDIQEFATKCQFSSNCTHEENSKGCYFQKLDQGSRDTELILSRLESYKKIFEEVSLVPDWQKKS